MSIFADREIVTSSATIATMSVFFGCVSQFTHRGNPEYYLGYGLIGAGTLLLLLTLMAARHRLMLKVLRYLLGAILVALLLGVLIGFDRVPGLGPRGQFVSLIEASGVTARSPA
jgi:hypothetical protein